MATDVKAPAATQLQPYIFFFGRCEEALEFYKSVFGGTYELMRTKDSPMADQMPPGSGDTVMHAKFDAPTFSFMCSDGRETKAIDPEAGNISLAVDVTDSAEGERIFKALGEGGEVRMPLDAAFWGGRFGMLVDRFGNEWMLTTP
jgi:PhnB protein